MFAEVPFHVPVVSAALFILAGLFLGLALGSPTAISSELRDAVHRLKSEPGNSGGPAIVAGDVSCILEQRDIELRDQAKELMRLEVALDRWRDECEEQRRRCQTAEEDREEAFQSLLAARQHLHDLQAELDHHRRAIEILERQGAAASTPPVLLTTAGPDPQAHQETLKRLDAAHQELQRLQMQIRRLEGQMVEQDHQMRHHGLERDSAVQETIALREERDALQVQLQDAERLADRIRVDRESSIQSLSQERQREDVWMRREEELEATIAMLREQLRMAQVQVQETVQRRLTQGPEPLPDWDDRAEHAVPSEACQPDELRRVLHEGHSRQELLARLKRHNQVLADRVPE